MASSQLMVFQSRIFSHNKASSGREEDPSNSSILRAQQVVDDRDLLVASSSYSSANSTLRDSFPRFRDPVVARLGLPMPVHVEASLDVLSSFVRKQESVGHTDDLMDI
jgi:hypothetical protein